ncbi:MAG: exodeoxyribonuclease VII large subunit [Burkholderiaceae bacterium]|nr:exodeoxyribonuclease VII large subunit [Burkholderiaceae bacterium]
MPRIWSVGALVLAVGDALAARFGACSVRGELSGFSRAASGHCYFTLKDADGAQASLRCAMFRRAAGLLDFAPRDGLQVELRGRLAVYEARGELQFVAEAMRALGAGSLYEQFLALKAKLEAEGLFDTARKRSLPCYPQRIGVISSLGAAALHDVLVALARRAPQVSVLIYPSLVQGAEAPAALVAALALAAERREVDTLILARGGGSLEDLWAFNDARVVRAVAASPIPIVCGVGHETDVSLADFAADLRAPTPTAAAELAVPLRDDALAQLDAWAQRLRRHMQRRLDGAAQRLDQRTLRLARPGQALARRAQQLQSLDARRIQALRGALRRAGENLPRLASRLRRAQSGLLALASLHLSGLGRRLDGLDPGRVLSRGYAWVTDSRGRTVVSARSVEVGQTLVTVWRDGRALTEVSRVECDGPGREQGFRPGLQ